MITSNVTIVYSQKGKELQLHVYIKRTSSYVFNMGDSSFLINFAKNSLSNPKLTFQRKKYSSGDYQPIECIMVLANRCVGLQLRCSGAGKPVISSGEYGEKIASFQMDVNNENYMLQWRSRDTEVVTPDKQPVETVYKIISNL